MGRPANAPSRAVFLTAVAPIRRLSGDGVALVVRRACQRAGVASIGPHRLRHTLATETLRAGAPMAEVAQLLRHADQATSSICRGRRHRGGGVGPSLARGQPMNTLLPAVRDYLDLRRSFGYVLAGQDRPLADFAGYPSASVPDGDDAAALAWAVEPETTPFVTTSAWRWCGALPPTCMPSTPAARSRRRTFCPRVAGGFLLISTATRRSLHS